MFLTSDDWKQAKDSNVPSRELSVEELYDAGVHLHAEWEICAGRPSFYTRIASEFGEQCCGWELASEDRVLHPVKKNIERLVSRMFLENFLVFAGYLFWSSFFLRLYTIHMILRVMTWISGPFGETSRIYFFRKNSIFRIIRELPTVCLTITEWKSFQAEQLASS